MDFTVSIPVPDAVFTGVPLMGPHDGTVIFGKPNDMSTREGRMFADLWGHQPRDQAARATAWTHLQAIPAGDRTYNLQDPKDFRDFVLDLQDGKLDGKADGNGFQGVSFGSCGKVMAGDKVYDISTPEGLQSLLRDNADGKVDGKIAQPVTDHVDSPPAPASGSDPFGPPPSTTSQCGNGHKPPAPPATQGKPPAAPPHPAGGSHKATVVDYDGKTYDLNTEEGRDALKARLAEDGIDYDTATNEVRCGDEVYDLDNEKGRRGFVNDAQDGLMDGHMGDDPSNVVYDGKRYDTTTEEGRQALEDAMEGYGVDYNRATNVVTVNGKQYDLDTKAGRRAFREDLADGILDGKGSGAKTASQPPREKGEPTGGRGPDKDCKKGQGEVQQKHTWLQPVASEGRPTPARAIPVVAPATGTSSWPRAETSEGRPTAARVRPGVTTVAGGSWRQHDVYRA